MMEVCKEQWSHDIRRNGENIDVKKDDARR